MMSYYIRNLNNYNIDFILEILGDHSSTAWKFICQNFYLSSLRKLMKERMHASLKRARNIKHYR